MHVVADVDFCSICLSHLKLRASKRVPIVLRTNAMKNPTAVQRIRTEDELQDWTQKERAALLLFGGARCSVCEAIKPKLQQMIDTDFPKMSFGYTECDGDGRALCAAHGLFSIPVVWIYFEGKRFSTFVRVFSLDEVREAIQRPYAMVFREE